VAESVEAPEVTVGGGTIPTLQDIDPEGVKRMGELDTQVDKALGSQVKGIEKFREESASARAASGPLREEAKQQLSRPIPQLGQLAQPPEAPSGPIIDPDNFKSFAAVAFPFALLLGKAMRADAFDAMNMLSSSVQGYVQGRREEATSKMQQFDAKMNEVLEKNKQKLDKYRATLERRDLENSQKLMMLKIDALSNDDIQTAHAAETKSFDSIFKRIEQERANIIKVSQAKAKIVSDFEKNKTAQERALMIKEAAALRYSYSANSPDALAQRKQKMLRDAAYKALADLQSEIAKISGNPLVGDKQANAAIKAAKEAFAFRMKYINETARLEGIAVPPEAEKAEDADFDPLTPPISQIDTKGEKRAWWDFWSHQTGSPPGVNPGVTRSAAPPQGPTQGGGWSAR
jgi:hypothetical protein